MDFKIYKKIEEIGESDWSRYVAKRFFLSYKYLHTLEVACPQLEYRYVICYKDKQFQGLCYFQLIPFSGKNLFQYIPNSNRIVEYVFKKVLGVINTRLLVLGNVIFTCENGVLITPKATMSSEEIVYKSLDTVLSSLAVKPLGTMISENISTVSSHIFCSRKFHEFKVEDRMEINLERFSNFQNYMDSLQSKYRVRLKKIYKLNETIEEIEINENNFSIYSAELEKLFYQVLDNSKFKLTTISVNYFFNFIKSVDRFKIKAYKSKDKLIGFVSYFELDTVIEVHYVGIDYQYNKDGKIYNYILYKILEHSFEKQINHVCYGRTAQELKSTLGAKPFSILSSLKLNYSFLNLLTPLFLNRMTPEKWVMRDPFKI